MPLSGRQSATWPRALASVRAIGQLVRTTALDLHVLGVQVLQHRALSLRNQDLYHFCLRSPDMAQKLLSSNNEL